MTLGERIREQRKIAGLSQEKVAELVGVSRQAVTKWETGQSSPSTENLFKLAEIFGTRVDILLSTGDEASSPAEQIYYLYKLEQTQKAAERRARWKKNLLLALLLLAGYLLLYLVPRFFTDHQDLSVMEWLFGTGHLPYLPGWLLKRKLFWIAMVITLVPALFGKKYFSCATLAGFAAGMLLGQLCGHNPAGAAYGYGHYGWLIWGCIFLFSIIMGMIGEKLVKRGSDRRKWLVFLSVFLLGAVAIVLLVRAGMPTAFS